MQRSGGGGVFGAIRSVPCKSGCRAASQEGAPAAQEGCCRPSSQEGGSASQEGAPASQEGGSAAQAQEGASATEGGCCQATSQEVAKADAQEEGGHIPEASSSFAAPYRESRGMGAFQEGAGRDPPDGRPQELPIVQGVPPTPLYP
eukprot:1843129-Alexandrium_andersonii.AAC.1